VDEISLVQQKLGKISAVLACDAGNECDGLGHQKFRGLSCDTPASSDKVLVSHGETLR